MTMAETSQKAKGELIVHIAVVVIILVFLCMAETYGDWLGRSAPLRNQSVLARKPSTRPLKPEVWHSFLPVPLKFHTLVRFLAPPDPIDR